MSSSSSSAPSSTNSKLSKLEKNQEEDYRSIKTNRKTTETNREDIKRNARDFKSARTRIKELQATVALLEKKMETIVSANPSASKSKPSATHKPRSRSEKAAPPGGSGANLAAKAKGMETKSAQLELHRSALIKCNEMIEALPEGEKYTWERKVTSKDGSTRTKVFDKIVDYQIMEHFLANEATRDIANNIFVSEGGEKLTLPKDMKGRYWVFLKDGKLTTISKDFKGGVGPEYFWTEDASLPQPSSDWVRNKRETDPRRKWVDPRTGALWVPEIDVIEVKEEDEEEEEKVVTEAESGGASPKKKGGADDDESGSDESSSGSDDESGGDDADGAKEKVAKGGGGTESVGTIGKKRHYLGEMHPVARKRPVAQEQSVAQKQSVAHKQPGQECAATSSDSSSEDESDEENASPNKPRFF